MINTINTTQNAAQRFASSTINTAEVVKVQSTQEEEFTDESENAANDDRAMHFPLQV